VNADQMAFVLRVAIPICGFVAALIGLFGKTHNDKGDPPFNLNMRGWTAFTMALLSVMATVLQVVVEGVVADAAEHDAKGARDEIAKVDYRVEVQGHNVKNNAEAHEARQINREAELAKQDRLDELSKDVRTQLENARKRGGSDAVLVMEMVSTVSDHMAELQSNAMMSNKVFEPFQYEKSGLLTTEKFYDAGLLTLDAFTGKTRAELDDALNARDLSKDKIAKVTADIAEMKKQVGTILKVVQEAKATSTQDAGVVAAPLAVAEPNGFEAGI
jgi:hypothetical protein